MKRMENNEMLKVYQTITKNYATPNYLPPEQQGRRIQRCTLLREMNVSYSNGTKCVTKK